MFFRSACNCGAKKSKQERRLFSENKGISGSLFSDSFVESVKRVNPSAEFRAGKRKSEGKLRTRSGGHRSTVT
jgi:hypothetical protein